MMRGHTHTHTHTLTHSHTHTHPHSHTHTHTLSRAVKMEDGRHPLTDGYGAFIIGSFFWKNILAICARSLKNVRVL